MSSLVCRNINKYFGETHVLRNISFSMKKNTINGFLGPNGAGKTTLINIISGILVQESGDVFINGKLKPKGVSSQTLGIIFEGNNNAYGYLTVEDNIAYFGYLNNLTGKQIRERSKTLLDSWDMTEHRKKFFYELSKGMQQKVLIMIAQIKEPEILILDEPTLGLDITSCMNLEHQLIKHLKETDKTVVVTSHDMSFINNVCDNIILIDQGELRFSGTIQEFKHVGNTGMGCVVVAPFSETLAAYLLKHMVQYTFNSNLIEFQISKLDLLGEISKISPVLDIKMSGSVSESFKRIIHGKHS